MSIEFVKGCLLQALETNKIAWAAHCVNCQSVMGSGVALSIKERYPNVFEEYLSFSEEVKTKWKQPLLGQVQKVRVAGFEELSRQGCDFYEKGVINIFGQEFYGYGKRQVNYGALGKAFTALSYGLTQGYEDSISEDEVIGFPYKFASDRAGGDWGIILEMIDFHFKDHKVKIYQLGG